MKWRWERICWGKRSFLEGADGAAGIGVGFGGMRGGRSAAGHSVACARLGWDETTDFADVCMRWESGGDT